MSATFLKSLVCLAAVGLLALAGCGSSSKPAYCTNRTNLENSIKGLTSLSPSNGLSGLQSQLKKIQTNATALANTAQSDFPTQTSALKSSVDTLTTTVKGLSGSPSASQIAKVATDAAGVVSAVKSFTSATASKCS